MIFEIWSNLFLLVCAVIDFKTKKVYAGICVINYGVAVGIKLLLNALDLKSLLAGLILCGFLFAVSLITKEAIGQGDILIIFVLTGILNAENSFTILVIALGICSVFSVVMLSMKKKKLKHVIPFVPFLFIGHLLWIVLGGRYV